MKSTSYMLVRFNYQPYTKLIMPPKLGFMNNPLNKVLNEIEKGLRIGFDYIELTVEWPLASVEILEENKTELRNSLASFNRPPLIHAPWYLEIASPYEDVRIGALREAKKIMKLTKEIEASLVAFHPFSPKWFSVLKEDAKKLNLEAFIRLVELGKENNMIVCIENTDTGFSPLYPP